MTNTSRLIADIGGTNTRLAIYAASTGQLQEVHSYTNRDYSGLADIIASYLDTVTLPRPQEACVAVAAAPSGDRVEMFNIDWSFSCEEIAGRFGFKQFRWINDFVAIANALPFLGEHDTRCLSRGKRRNGDKLAAMGPGTGLGGATIQNVGGHWLASSAEPGHAGLSPGNALEYDIFHALHAEYDNIYAELLVSGPGLLRVYSTLCALRGQAAQGASPAEISQLATQRGDALAMEAVGVFCALLGSVCGDFVLNNGAYGGLYLAGGILPGMIDQLNDSDFFQRFTRKGGMATHLKDVPVFVITTEQPGLIGAAHAVIQD